MFQISSVQWSKNKSYTSESLYVYCKLKSMLILLNLEDLEPQFCKFYEKIVGRAFRFLA